MSLLSDRLKELRLKNDLTQKQMGEVLGCTDRYYQKIEYGNVKPSQENLMKLADCFGVSTDFLLGRISDPDAIMTTRLIQKLMTDNRICLEAKGLYAQLCYYTYDDKIKLPDVDEFCKNNSIRREEFDTAIKELESFGYIKIKGKFNGEISIQFSSLQG